MVVSRIQDYTVYINGASFVPSASTKQLYVTMWKSNKSASFLSVLCHICKSKNKCLLLIKVFSPSIAHLLEDQLGKEFIFKLRIAIQIEFLSD